MLKNTFPMLLLSDTLENFIFFDGDLRFLENHCTKTLIIE